MFCETVEKSLFCSGIVPVTIVNDVSHAVPLARALLAGGIEVIELTLRTPVAMDAIRAIREEVPSMFVGAGTVLTPEQARECHSAGAAFAVAPGTNPRTIQAAQDCGLPFAPGVMTPSDIETSLGFDCRMLKFFPASTIGGLAHLKIIAAPYLHLGLRFIPTGGIDFGQLQSYLESPLIAAVGGSWIAKAEHIKSQNWAEITALAAASKKIVGLVREC